jgi:MoxR-like ATPase
MFMEFSQLNERIREQSIAVNTLRAEISKVIVGQQDMVDSLIMGMIGEGHILLEGVPGLAKTTAVKAFADATELEFKRIQFTPDLLPADIIGSRIFNMNDRNFEIKKGVIFQM